MSILPRYLNSLISILLNFRKCSFTHSRKTPKNSDTQNVCCNHHKILPLSNTSKRCRQNGKQCRPWSDCSSRSSLIWVYTVCSGLWLQKLGKIRMKQGEWVSRFPWKSRTTGLMLHSFTCPVKAFHSLGIQLSWCFSFLAHLSQRLIDEIVWAGIRRPPASSINFFKQHLWSQEADSFYPPPPW